MGSWKELISLTRFEADISMEMKGVESLYGGSFWILERARLDNVATFPVFFDAEKTGCLLRECCAFVLWSGVAEVIKE